MTALLFPVAMGGPTLVGSARAFMGWMLLLEAACMGTFLALDLFLFFIMFEVTLVPGYFIIAGWGGFRRNYAAMKFFIYTFAGSAFLFVAILSLVLLTAPANHGHESFSLITLARLASGLPHADQVLHLHRLRHRLRRQDPAGARSTAGCPTPTPRRPRPGP